MRFDISSLATFAGVDNHIQMHFDNFQAHCPEAAIAQNCDGFDIAMHEIVDTVYTKCLSCLLQTVHV